MRKKRKSMVDPEADVAGTLGIDSVSTKSKRKKRWFVLAVLLIMAIAAVTGIRKWQGGHPLKIEYRTQEVRRGDLTVIVSATGTLQPTNELDVGSELSGSIKSVEVDANDQVKVGQVLVQLDTSKLNAELAQSKASLELAKAKVLVAQATIKETRSKLTQFKKVWELSNQKLPSLTEMDAAEADFERAIADEASAKAEVSKAEAALEAIETDMSKAVIRSPIKGIVLTREVDPGQTVAASFETPVLLTLAEDLTQMELHVDVDEADVGQVKKGQDATFTVDAYPDRIFKARIIKVHYASQTTEGVVTYETVLDVANSDLSLRPGMTATADIIVKKVAHAVLVPNAALRFTPPLDEKKGTSNGLLNMLIPHPPAPSNSKQEEKKNNGRDQEVWILRNGSPMAVQVTTGATDGTMTEVLNGNIDQGEQVLVDVIMGKR